MMTIFDDAKEKARIKNLPTHYDPVRKGRVYRINASSITQIWIDGHVHTRDDYSDDVIFDLFVYDNYYKCDEIWCDKITRSYCYELHTN